MLENNNVTNLLYLIKGNKINDIESVIKPMETMYYIKSIDKENIELIQNTWKKLIRKIFVDYKNNDYSNVKNLIEKYSSYIELFNNNINIDDLKIVIDGNYIRIKYYGVQLAYLSFGNAKLKENEYGEGFIIWNLIGKITCNGKTKLCSKYCYNMSRQTWKNLTPKISNLIFSLLDVFEPTINKVILTVTTRYKKTYFRIHEDGDYYNMEYFNKWLNILKVNTNIQFTAYTKEPKLLGQINDLNNQYNNLVLRYSIMEDTSKHILETIQQNNIPCYVVMGKKPFKMCSEKEKREIKELENQIVNLPETCKKSCKYCKECYKLNINRIFTTMH